MTNRLFIIGAVIVAALYVFFSSIYIVDEREQAIVLRLGQITDIRTEPGIYFMMPTQMVVGELFMINRLSVTVAVIVAALSVFFSSISIVAEREQAIVMRFGQITDIRTEPGIYFKIPPDIVDSVQVVEDRLLRYDIAN